LNFVSQFHDDREIATAANQTLAHLRPHQWHRRRSVKSVKSVVFYFLPQRHYRHHHWSISSLTLSTPPPSFRMVAVVQL
jgi:hypothetical protein